MNQKQQQEYNEYVEQITPKASLVGNMLKAFLVGGTICLYGQVLSNWIASMGVDEKTTASWTSLLLVLTSAVLTGLNIYPLFAKWGGAGALVPITGFANSVTAPAIEFQKEGWVNGVGCKIFTICGPVILYGILTSWGLGLIYWIGKVLGVV